MEPSNFIDLAILCTDGDVAIGTKNDAHGESSMNVKSVFIAFINKDTLYLLTVKPCIFTNKW